MFTFRNVFALVLFLFGTTFLWLSATWTGSPATGTIWTLVQVLAFATIIGFAAGAWGVFKQTSWWQPIVIVSAIIGLIVLIPYSIGASLLGVANIWTNVALHAIGSVAVLIVLLVAPAHEWLLGRL
jgi:hypothetical protein